MENELTYMSDEIFTNEGIKIAIPLTGKVLPTEFKHMISDAITADFSRNMLNELDELLENGFINAEIKKGNISLILTLNADGTFTNVFELEYKCINRPYGTIQHKFIDGCIPRDYIALYRKKALRILNRRIKNGLKLLADLPEKSN